MATTKSEKKKKKPGSASAFPLVDCLPLHFIKKIVWIGIVFFLFIEYNGTIQYIH